MSPVKTTFSRTFGRLKNQLSSAFTVWAFLSSTAAIFAFSLANSEGASTTLAAVWADAVSRVLPIFAAFLTMDVWSEERLSGRFETLLSSPVKERDLVMGKFLGCWAFLTQALIISIILSLSFLYVFAPAAIARARLEEFIPAFAILAIQGLLWCAVATSSSALFRTAGASLASSLLITLALPRGIWAAWSSWVGAGRTAFGEMPLDAHVADFASATISTGVLALYFLSTGFFVFAASKAVARLRMVGRKALKAKLSALTSVVLAGIFTVLAIMLAFRLETTFDIPIGGSRASFSPRTRTILSEAGELSVTCFLRRSDTRFRQVARFLRQLRREAESTGGAQVTLKYIDPVWDIGAAERLARGGIEDGSLVFSRGRRTTVLNLDDGWGERACASTIRRLLTPPARKNVYWTTGHGEALFDAYGPFGMSDIGRDLAREGYVNKVLDLSAHESVPSDCALVIIAGAQHDFSRTEISRLESYLRDSGRVMMLVGAKLEGLSSILTSWGIRPTDALLGNAKTLSGSDVIADEFADHEISAQLAGNRVIFERPTAFKPSAAATSGSGADKISFTAIAGAQGNAFAAAAERGANAGRDLAVRPTRIVAVGDAAFAMNGPLAARANANRDFFLNSVAYLSGTDSSGSSGTETEVLVSGMDRAKRLNHLLLTAVAAPLAIFLLMLPSILRRRSR
ncbi:MAG: Gldg family protein [Kiritimatiellae bacterium]|nr:Gldg family protein [Kiritimatiellia bacterium]